MIGHYLMFEGNCAQALATYERAFDAKATHVQRYKDMPPNPNFPVSEERKAWILNSRLQIAGSEIMCADGSATLQQGNNMYVTVTTQDAAIVQKAWDILQEGGEVHMPLQPSFFAVLHGSLRDAFGINWMFTALKEH